MSLSAGTTALGGSVAAGYQSVRDLLERESHADPEYSFQLAVYRGGELVVDLHGGEGIAADSLMVPFSVSKNAIGFSIAVLVDRGLLDLDARVADYWPEFGSHGKQDVRVSELLSHQVGLPEAIPTLSDEEVAVAAVGAARLVDQLPWWRPGAAFGYHGVTIGVLASELVRRITGRTLQEFFDAEIRAPRSLDFYLGIGPELESRVVELQPVLPQAGAAEPIPFSRTPGQIGRAVFANVTIPRPPDEQAAHLKWQRSVGAPAVYATVSALGIAGLFAEAVAGVTGEPFVSPQTIARMAQTQVVGIDQVIGIGRSYGIVFQKPTPNLAFGGFRAFGHDGAGGALGFHDPATGISLGYTVRRTPPPGGADARALAVAALVQRIELSRA
ncbi:serine hydrolase domain-containing protein [Microbacterium sp. NPDC056569]|uniref:serine hydrolase domain-containing protein n=1 Tax=Microbacterium sp. NPDC056569 TaxID=3345867 RepID=UPI00366ADBED